MKDCKYLVRWIRKTGEAQVYEVHAYTPRDLSKGATFAGTSMRRLSDKCWQFRFGIAALADSVNRAMVYIEKEKSDALALVP